MNKTWSNVKYGPKVFTIRCESQTSVSIAIWFEDINILFQIQVKLNQQSSKMDKNQNQIRSPDLIDDHGAALNAQKLQKDKIQGSRLALGTLLGLLLKAHRGAEAFQKGFGRGLRCASL